jgi:hypothetical protein
MRLSALVLSAAMVLAPLTAASADEVLPVFPVKLEATFLKNNSTYRVALRFENRENLAEIYCENALIGAAKIDLTAQLKDDANIVGLDLESAEALPKCSKDFILRLYTRNFDAPGAEEVSFHDLTFSDGKLASFGR